LFFKLLALAGELSSLKLGGLLFRKTVNRGFERSMSGGGSSWAELQPAREPIQKSKTGGDPR